MTGGSRKALSCLLGLKIMLDGRGTRDACLASGQIYADRHARASRKAKGNQGPTRTAVCHSKLISGIMVTANKSLESITFSIDYQLRDGSWERSSKRTLHATLFHPPLDSVDSSDQITLNLHYHWNIARFSMPRKGQRIIIKASELSNPGQDGISRSLEEAQQGAGVSMSIGLHLPCHCRYQ